MIFDTKPDTPGEALAQSGVKGMKWGVRNSKPSGSEIHEARGRQAARGADFRKAIRESKSKDPKVAKAGAKKLKKVSDDFHTNEDRVTAARTTKGEKAALIILGGPLGLTVLAAAGANRRAITRNVDKRRAAQHK